jgi:hypothetical protein
LLVGSTSLALGATIFEFACPARVKEFSRTRWVEELRRPGLLYVVDTLQRPWLNGLALLFSAIGAATLGYLFVDRLIAVLVMVTVSGSPDG